MTDRMSHSAACSGDRCAAEHPNTAMGDAAPAAVRRTARQCCMDRGAAMTSTQTSGPALITWTPTLQLWQGDCLAVLRNLPDSSVHSVVTDPPYGLSDHTPDEVVAALTAWVQGDRKRVPDGKGFMGRSWDRFVPPPAVWDECLRVLKPGGYMAVFAGSRTADLMGLSIRLAGFEIRDTITWMYGSGFPKSLDVGKAIDKAAGAAREVIGANPKAIQQTGQLNTAALNGYRNPNLWLTEPSTEAAKQWDGWGTALKPASEPIIVARKPFPGTVASNVLKHSTAGINVDACRIPAVGRPHREVHALRPEVEYHGTSLMGRIDGSLASSKAIGVTDQGRWPANVVLSHASTPDGFDACADGCVEGCPVAVLDTQSGQLAAGGYPAIRNADTQRGTYGEFAGQQDLIARRTDTGGASRFFNVFRYQAKAPKSERPVINDKAHPTVKPLALMRWLAVLFTPPGGTVLDPFTGSGTTGEAAQLDGFEAILIDDDPTSIAWTQQRLRKAG